MAKRWKDKHRDCVVCGDTFEVGKHNGMAITCGPECGKERRRQTKRAYLPTEYVKRRARRSADLETWRAKEAAFSRKYREQNPQPGRDRAKKYQADNREAVKAAKQRYYAENRERIRASQQAWERNNRQKINAKRRREYAKKKGSVVRAWRRRTEGANADG